MAGKVYMTPWPSESCQPDPHTQHGQSPRTRRPPDPQRGGGTGAGRVARSRLTTLLPPSRDAEANGTSRTVTCMPLQGHRQHQPLRTALPPTPFTRFVLFWGSGNTWFTFHVKPNKKARLRRHPAPLQRASGQRLQLTAASSDLKIQLLAGPGLGVSPHSHAATSLWGTGW